MSDTETTTAPSTAADVLDAFRDVIDTHSQLWDAQRALEDVLGFDVNDIPDTYTGLLVNYDTGRPELVTPDELAVFIEAALAAACQCEHCVEGIARWTVWLRTQVEA